MSQQSMLNNLIQLAAIGQLSVDLHAANNAVRNAKWVYYEALAEYKDEHGTPVGRLDPRDPLCAPIIEFTKAEYAAYLAAKRKVYNLQRRIDRACMKVGA